MDKILQFISDINNQPKMFKAWLFQYILRYFPIEPSIPFLLLNKQMPLKYYLWFKLAIFLNYYKNTICKLTHNNIIPNINRKRSLENRKIS